MSDQVDSVAEKAEVTAPVDEQANPSDTPVMATPEAAVADESEPTAFVEGTPAAESADDATEGAQVVEDGSEDVEMEIGEDGSTRVVRTLRVGQEVPGVVKRITDFGAFIDIGVGRDGLIHISELSIRRVGKVTDVLSAGQEVTTWIKELDRKRNRISLTMIEPGTKTIRDLEKGQIVHGTVTRILPYGAFVDVGIGRDALLHVREMGEGFVAKPEDVVQVGAEIDTLIIDVSRRRSRVDLSLKGLRPEPEPEAQPVAQPVAAREAVSEVAAAEPVDEFEGAEVLTTMELAFKRAMESGGAVTSSQSKHRKADRKHPETTSIQDEIIARTLESKL